MNCKRDSRWGQVRRQMGRVLGLGNETEVFSIEVFEGDVAADLEK